MAKWQSKLLGDACRFIDYRGRTPEKTQSGLRLITAKNVKMGFLQVEPLEYVHPSTYETWMTRGIPKKGDVLFTTEAPLANVAQLDTSEKVVFAQRIIVLQPFSSDLDTTFLKYLLLSDSAQQRILEKGTGATVQGIKASLLKLIEIKYPSILEQQRIVAILDETFEGIATAKASAEKNLQSTWELFEGYLESLFPLGVTGTGVRPLGEIASFRNGVNFTKQSKGQSVPIIGVKDFKKNFWAPMEELDSVTMDGQLSAIDAVQAGDILSVRSNGNPELIGRCILVPEHEGGVTHSGFTIRIRVESAVALPQYVCHYLKSQAARRELVAGGTGTNIKSLNQGTLASILVPLPPLVKQKRVIQTIEAMADEVDQLKCIYKTKLAALDELKQSLLHRAFNGDL